MDFSEGFSMEFSDDFLYLEWIFWSAFLDRWLTGYLDFFMVMDRE